MVQFILSVVCKWFYFVPTSFILVEQRIVHTTTTATQAVTESKVNNNVASYIANFMDFSDLKHY